MRIIGQLEKRIIDRLCRDRPAMLAELLCNNIPDLNLKIENKDPLGKSIDISFIMEKESDEIFRRKMFELVKQVIYIFNFLLYLEQEGYIVSGYFAHGRTAQGYFSNIPEFQKHIQNNGSQYVHVRFPDERYEQKLFDYADRVFVPTYHLVSFKNRGYKNAEDVRHRQTMWVAWIAIAISLILGLISIL